MKRGIFSPKLYEFGDVLQSAGLASPTCCHTRVGMYVVLALWLEEASRLNHVFTNKVTWSIFCTNLISRPIPMPGLFYVHRGSST